MKTVNGQMVNSAMVKLQDTRPKSGRIWRLRFISPFHYFTTHHFTISLLRHFTISLLTTSLFHYSTISLHAAAFEPLGYGAAANGMGGAYTARADDNSASYWNPAGLALIKRPQITSSYQDLYGLGLLRYTTLGYAQPNIGGGTVGINLLRLSTTGEASFFNYAENTYLFSYARHVWRGLDSGMNLKYYTATADQKASGIGFDFGLLYRPRNDRYRLGLTWKDMNEPRVRWETGAVDVLPPSFNLGGTLKIGPISEVSVDEVWRRHEKQGLRAGMAHYLVNRMFVVRTGVHRNSGQAEWNLSLGGGLRFRRLDFDYSWDRDDLLGNTQTFSLGVRFGS